jgi:hypothetical protein
MEAANASIALLLQSTRLVAAVDDWVVRRYDYALHEMDFLGDLFELACGSARRFYASVLLSVAISSLALWLVPSRGWSIAISITSIVTGIIAGVIWERRSR